MRGSGVASKLRKDSPAARRGEQALGRLSRLFNIERYRATKGPTVLTEVRLDAWLSFCGFSEQIHEWVLDLKNGMSNDLLAKTFGVEI